MAKVKADHLILNEITLAMLGFQSASSMRRFSLDLAEPTRILIGWPVRSITEAVLGP